MELSHEQLVRLRKLARQGSFHAERKDIAALSELTYKGLASETVYTRTPLFSITAAGRVFLELFDTGQVNIELGGMLCVVSYKREGEV